MTTVETANTECPSEPAGGIWRLTFDMSGGAKARSGLWDVRSMEGLGAWFRSERKLMLAPPTTRGILHENDRPTNAFDRPV